MTDRRLGYVGLGNMGAAMVANLIAAGRPVSVYDSAGTGERAPPGATPCHSIADIARDCDVVFICVPDGPASKAVVADVLACQSNSIEVLINLSTTGIAAAGEIAGMLDASPIAFVDAPVSGGRAGAIHGSITVMWSGRRDLMDDLKPVLKDFSRAQFFVGERPGQGQALKLLNNYLSATAMAATSEAMVFGAAQGLDMQVVLDAVNVSTGRNTATSDKFPNRVVTETYDAGFRLALMEKDVALYLSEAQAAGVPDALSRVVADYLTSAIDQFPDGDFTELYKLIVGRAR